MNFMIVEVVVPSPGESITEVELTNWLVADGDMVKKDQDIAEIDSDKATLSIAAPESGKIKLMATAGTRIAVGSLLAQIETAAIKTEINVSDSKNIENKETKTTHESTKTIETNSSENSKGEIVISPQAQQLLETLSVNIKDVLAAHKGKRITKKDVLLILSSKIHTDEESQTIDGTKLKMGRREQRIVPLSSLRRKLSERLVAVKNQTAMLTTFNEVDMTEVLKLRTQYNAAFVEKYGTKLGLMSFFAMAVCKALKEYPQVSAQIDGESLIFFDYVDLSIAVSTPKGLMTPVIHNAELMGIPEIEIHINALAQKARNNKISIEELTGGTFTITNGGVFGSMLSTPILNPPQSAILGMHNIVERPIAINGKVEIRPIMYVALSYDHRVIDGRESVGFLVKVKNYIENPLSLLVEQANPSAALLGL